MQPPLDSPPVQAPMPSLRWGPAHVLVFLLAVDAVFFGLHLFHRFGIDAFLAPQFNLTSEIGYAESFQHLKELGIAASLLVLAVRVRSNSAALWGLFFAYLMLDDSIEVHESMGLWLSQEMALSARWGLRAVDFGELVWSGFVAAVFALLLFAAWRQADPASRRLVRHLLALFAALAFFGVVVDMLHSVANAHQIAGLGVVEDGGEMLVMSIIFAYAIGRLRQSGSSRTPGS